MKIIPSTPEEDAAEMRRFNEATKFRAIKRAAAEKNRMAKRGFVPASTIFGYAESWIMNQQQGGLKY